MSDEIKGSKKDLKERITGIFKKSGSSSRGNRYKSQKILLYKRSIYFSVFFYCFSLERSRTDIKVDSSSTHRPLIRNDSSSNIRRTSPGVGFNLFICNNKNMSFLCILQMSSNSKDGKRSK